MSTSTKTTPADSGPEPDQFETADQYARDVIASTDRPVTAAELADQYGCSPGHMRRTLRTLTQDGVAVRVNRGEYLPVELASGTSDSADGQFDVTG